jgi:hypothetical protein
MLRMMMVVVGGGAVSFFNFSSTQLFYLYKF